MAKVVLGVAIAALFATPAVCAPWERGYVIGNYEPAFFYGAKTGASDPGTDCPKGANPDNNYRVILKTAWRSDDEVRELTRTVTESGKNPTSVMNDALAHRGFRKDIETYINPFTAPDPGVQEVTGKIAEGFDLDGNAKTGGFTSPDGRHGIDNAYYRVMGCGNSYRGVAYQGYLSSRGNDKMLDGLYTMVVRISGNQDPMNDSDARVEIGYSPDHVVKDCMANALSDYSFRIVKTAQYSSLKATIKNGVVETEQAAELRMPSFAWYDTNRGETVLFKGRMRLQMQPGWRAVRPGRRLSGLSRSLWPGHIQCSFRRPIARDDLFSKPDRAVLRLEAQCRRHAGPQDRRKHRHFHRLSLSGAACLRGRSRNAGCHQ